MEMYIGLDVSLASTAICAVGRVVNVVEIPWRRAPGM